VTVQTLLDAGAVTVRSLAMFRPTQPVALDAPTTKFSVTPLGRLPLMVKTGDVIEPPPV
jgi:hypothetical protein